MTDRYQIPKTRLPVEIHRDGHRALEATLFLREAAHGPESVIDLLGSDRRFIVVEDAGEVVFFNRENIARVTLADAHAFDAHGGLALSADLATEAALVLELEDGAKLTGLAVYQLQAETSRVGDFLEAAGDFFPFFRDDRVSYVNKRKIAQVHLQPPKE